MTDDRERCYISWIDAQGNVSKGGTMKLRKIRAIENRPDLEVGDMWDSQGFLCRLASTADDDDDRTLGESNKKGRFY
jgi:hypothetical protein